MSGDSTREYVRCNLCGADDYSIVYKSTLGAEDFFLASQFTVMHGPQAGRIVRCNKCGLTYINPRDPQGRLEEGYKSLSCEEYLLERSGRERTFRKDLRLIHRFRNPPGKLLDIGCQAGLFLNVARANGWDTAGVELSKAASDYAREQFGLNVFNCSLKEAVFPSNSFDVVTAFDVIEHLADPAVFVKEARRILKKDGIFVVATPDIGSATARVAGRHWACITRIHIYYFSKKTVIEMLYRSGFNIKKIKTYGRFFRMSYLAEKAACAAHCGFLKKIFPLIPRVGRITLPVNLFDNVVVVAGKA